MLRRGKRKKVVTDEHVEEEAVVERETGVVEREGFAAVRCGADDGLYDAEVLSLGACGGRSMSIQRLMTTTTTTTTTTNRTSDFMVESVEETVLEVDGDGLERWGRQKVAEAVLELVRQLSTDVHGPGESSARPTRDERRRTKPDAVHRVDGKKKYGCLRAGVPQPRNDGPKDTHVLENDRSSSELWTTTTTTTISSRRRRVRIDTAAVAVVQERDA